MDKVTMQKKAHVIIAEIDPKELMCRMLEAELKRARPHGTTPQQALDYLPKEDQDALERSAKAAVMYVHECINNARQPS